MKKPPMKAIYIGKVSKYGSRVVEKNGRECLEFALILPSQQLKPDGYRTGFYVNVSAWGPADAPLDKKPLKGELVMVMGIPQNKERANSLMAFTKDIAIGADAILNYLNNFGREDEEE